MLRLLSTLSLVALAACSRGEGSGSAPASSIPRFAHDEALRELDPLVRERLEQGLAECERGTSGALLELARVYDANGLPALAAETYRLCLERGGAELGGQELRVRHQLACCLEQCSQSEAALLAFEELRALAPDYAPAHWRAGNLLIEQGRSAEARRAFETALALEPPGVAQRIGLARVHLYEGRPAEAAATLEPLARERPRERFVHGLLARARRALGDEAGARAHLAAEERALETSWVDPWAAEVHGYATGAAAAMRKANERLLAGDARAAMAELAPVYERAPDNLALLQLFAKACLEAGELERASTVVAAGRALDPRQYRLDLYAGRIALARKNYPRAAKELRASLALNPSYAPTHAALGEVELQVGSLEAAERSFERALEQGDADLRTRILLAQVEIRLGKLERACALLEQARTDFPGSAVPATHLAEAQARRGNLDEARAALSEAQRLDASFPYLATVRGLIEDIESGAGR